MLPSLISEPEILSLSGQLTNINLVRGEVTARFAKYYCFIHIKGDDMDKTVGNGYNSFVPIGCHVICERAFL